MNVRLSLLVCIAFVALLAVAPGAEATKKDYEVTLYEMTMSPSYKAIVTCTHGHSKKDNRFGLKSAAYFDRPYFHFGFSENYMVKEKKSGICEWSDNHCKWEDGGFRLRLRGIEAESDGKKSVAELRLMNAVGGGSKDRHNLILNQLTFEPSEFNGQTVTRVIHYNREKNTCPATNPVITVKLKLAEIKPLSK